MKNTCKNCSIETTNPIFCSKSCSATYNNKYRKLSTDTKNNISKSLTQKFNLDLLIQLLDERKSVSNICVIMGVCETTIRKKIKENNLVIYKKPKTITKSFSDKKTYSKLDFCVKHNITFKIGKTGKKYCKDCNNDKVKQVRINRKVQCIEYKGGKCSQCGYKKCISALEFHHLNPLEKDFAISKSNRTSFKKLKPELDKCILVCSNCHREIHEKLRIN